jgi:alpha-galactosidase
MWPMVKLPLILGHDVRSMTDETRSIIGNPAGIAISQDPLGVPANRRYKRTTSGGNIQLWAFG